MNIIIIGGGSIGYNLADRLSTSRHHITLVDRDPDLGNTIANKIDVITIFGSGTDFDVLEKAGIKNADMVIAVTPYDDTNILCCSIAKQYRVRKRIARLKSHKYTRIDSPINLTDLGVTQFIEPEHGIVNSIRQFVELPGVTESANFQSDNVLLRGYRITDDMPLAGKTLFEINSLTNAKPMLIVQIIRSGRGIMPTGSEKLFPGDEIITIMPNDSLPAFKSLIGKNNTKNRKIIIFGDTFTANYLAEMLEKTSNMVTLVSPSEERGRIAAEQLNRTEVLFGDCTDVELLQELRVQEADFFIAVAKDSEDNIMSALLAKAEGTKRVIAVTTNSRHENLFHTLGIDHIVNPRTITMQQIIASIFKVPIGSMLKLRSTDIEVSRFIAKKSSKVTGKSLMSINGLSRRLIFIGCVVRNDEVIIPSGQTIIKENDEVLVICHKNNIKLAEKFFRSSISIEF